MRLPTWLRRRKRKNPFEGSLIIDNPDIKVVEAKYDKKPVLLAVGTSKQRELIVSGEGGTEKLKAKIKTQKDLEWQILYNPKALPDFIPIEKAKDLMVGTIAVTSGSPTVYEPQTKILERTAKELEDSLKKSYHLSDTDVTSYAFHDPDLEVALDFFEEKDKKTKKDKSKQER